MSTHSIKLGVLKLKPNIKDDFKNRNVGQWYTLGRIRQWVTFKSVALKNFFIKTSMFYIMFKIS